MVWGWLKLTDSDLLRHTPSPRNLRGGELLQDHFPTPHPIHGQDAITDADSPPLAYQDYFGACSFSGLLESELRRPTYVECV